MMTDGTLLREYTQSGSEAAFAELVGRHLDFVYSTALRELGGDGELAKDVSQSVFLDLAKKANALWHRSTLTGWFYTSTCFAASKAMRSECRRRTREQEASTMQESTTQPSRDADWEQIAPVLNRAMLELKASDREALLLRFFERRSLAAVGGELGLNENAARMRVERALERLRDHLRRYGITSTASALALTLSNQAVTAAPAGLAASITVASLAGAGGGLSVLNLILMSKAKTIGIGAVIAAGALTPVVVQYQTNGRLQSEIARLRTQVATAPGPQAVVADSAELERLQREHEELIRLRGQVSQLRQQLANQAKVQNDSPKVERGNASIKGRLPNEANNAKALLARSPEIQLVPANSWVNAGNATPQASLQTMNWATANRDTNVLLGAIGFEPGARELADRTFAQLPETIREKYRSVDGLLLDWRMSLGPSLESYRVLSQTEHGPGDVTLTVQFVYADETVRENEIRYYRDETGGWRHAIPPQAMQKMPHIVNALVEAPSANAGK